MRQLHTRPLAILVVLIIAMRPVAQADPTGALNDTGQIRCLNAAGKALEACSDTNTGNASHRPGQDGRFGRDPAAANPAQSGLTKPAGSGGSGGFVFTPLDVNGNAIPLNGSPPVPSNTPRCIKDNVTNLIWEVKTDDNGLQDMDWIYGWGANNTGNCYPSQSPAGCGSNNYITALNAANVCAVSGAGPWRLPTRRELLSIVDHDSASGLAIDSAYFPNTAGDVYVSADAYAPVPASAWSVDFGYGETFSSNTAPLYHVRLVRSGQ